MLTGIKGFDDITQGGLPLGRSTLIMGGPGCGKTVFALQSLVYGARKSHEAGLFVAFVLLYAYCAARVWASCPEGEAS